MELMARGIRQSTMMSPRQVRGTVLAVLLCSALAGCGSVTASAPAGAGASSSAPATSSSQASSSAQAASSAPAASSASDSRFGGRRARDRVRQRQPGHVGHRAPHHSPGRADPGGRAQQDPAQRGPGAGAVRPVLRGRSAIRRRRRGWSAARRDYGISYTGTFYDGTRTLATFIYGASGCQTVSLTADGQTKTTMVLGAASTAAPKLRADMAAVLGVPRLAIAQPVSGSGANK